MRLEARGNMGLSAQIIDFVAFNLAQNTCEFRGIRQIAIVQLEPGVIDVWVFVNVINSRRIEHRRATFDAMHLIALGQ